MADHRTHNELLQRLLCLVVVLGALAGHEAQIEHEVGVGLRLLNPNG